MLGPPVMSLQQGVVTELDRMQSYVIDKIKRLSTVNKYERGGDLTMVEIELRF